FPVFSALNVEPNLTRAADLGSHSRFEASKKTEDDNNLTNAIIFIVAWLDVLKIQCVLIFILFFISKITPRRKT
ncbi:hypothetical protein L9F63_025373, partial [Diploptera punctata]